MTCLGCAAVRRGRYYQAWLEEEVEGDTGGEGLTTDDEDESDDASSTVGSPTTTSTRTSSHLRSRGRRTGRVIVEEEEEDEGEEEEWMAMRAPPPPMLAEHGLVVFGSEDEEEEEEEPSLGMRAARTDSGLMELFGGASQELSLPFSEGYEKVTSEMGTEGAAEEGRGKKRGRKMLFIQMEYCSQTLVSPFHSYIRHNHNYVPVASGGVWWVTHAPPMCVSPTSCL